VGVAGEAWGTLTADQWGAMTADQWGELVTGPGGLPVVSGATDNLGMAGRKQYYLDPETRLYLLGGGNSDSGGRYYDPATARFTSEDPVRQDAGDENLYRYVGNDPVNKHDPSGHDATENRGIPSNLKPPPHVPVIFVFRYTEEEWAKRRIARGEEVQFGRYSYMAVDKTDDPETTTANNLSNAGRALHDFFGAPILAPYSLFTWSNKFSGPRERIDYVDVTFKLLYRHYQGPVTGAERSQADDIFFKNYTDQKLSSLSGQLNKELEYFYIEQFGGAVLFEAAGAVLRFRSVKADVELQLGGPGSKSPEFFSARRGALSAEQAGRVRREFAMGSQPVLSDPAAQKVVTQRFRRLSIEEGRAVLRDAGFTESAAGAFEKTIASSRGNRKVQVTFESAEHGWRKVLVDSQGQAYQLHDRGYIMGYGGRAQASSTASGAKSAAFGETPRSASASSTAEGSRASLPEHKNLKRELPFGYKEEPFRRFVRDLDSEMRQAGYDDAEAFMQGRAASGAKYNRGNPIPLNARAQITPEDYDVAIVSPKMIAKAKESGLRNFLSGPLDEKQLAALGLAGARQRLTAASKGGKPVNFKLYESIHDVLEYDITIPFSHYRS
jgi:RHS repeat-associated protein